MKIIIRDIIWVTVHPTKQIEAKKPNKQGAVTSDFKQLILNQNELDICHHFSTKLHEYVYVCWNPNFQTSIENS